MRPSWKGTLTIGLVSVPVHLYATADKKSTAPVGHNVRRSRTTRSGANPAERKSPRMN
jgi:non-homologous end joining protein Ku